MEQQKPNRMQRLMKHLRPKNHNHRLVCEFATDKKWLDLCADEHSNKIKKLDDLIYMMKYPNHQVNEEILNKIQGSLVGLALGDALGAHVEFRPRAYLEENPVNDLEGGGTWGLKKGQFTDDTSMALCLAISLITRLDFVPYDQLVRYKWWWQRGYMSSTGKCFDIGAGTQQSLQVFFNRQRKWANKHRTSIEQLDYLSDDYYLQKFNVYCSTDDVAGNGALMRLAPVPLFFYKFPSIAIDYSGISGKITHGDRRAYDACRYFGALICAVLNGMKKKELLDNNFYKRQENFIKFPLCDEIRIIAEGSYKQKGGYANGIRGKGYIVLALEAALWAFWSDEDCFKKGVLAAVNLGDDTDTTAAIYGQLAGAYYGYDRLPKEWVEQVYAKEFLLNISSWIAYEGEKWEPKNITSVPHESSKTTAYLSCDNLTYDESTRDYSRSQALPTAQLASTEKKSIFSRLWHPFRSRKRSKDPSSPMFSSPQPQRRPPLVGRKSSLPY